MGLSWNDTCSEGFALGAWRMHRRTGVAGPITRFLLRLSFALLPFTLHIFPHCFLELSRVCCIPWKVSQRYPPSTRRSTCRYTRNYCWITKEEADGCQNTAAFSQMWFVDQCMINYCFPFSFNFSALTSFFLNPKVSNLEEIFQTFIRL